MFRKLFFGAIKAAIVFHRRCNDIDFAHIIDADSHVKAIAIVKDVIEYCGFTRFREAEKDGNGQ